MNGKGKTSEHERRDWIIILIVLLFGFLCVILAGERAIRFAPNWKLDTNMQSNLDPDSDFLTNKPVGYHGPLDPSILTQPSRINVFQTPCAFFETRVPQVPTNTPTVTNTPIPTLFFSPTAIRPSPTSTSVIFPPFPTSTRTSPPATSVVSATPSPTRTPINTATQTPVHSPTATGTATQTPIHSPTATRTATRTATPTSSPSPTATSIPPTLIPVDLSITKTDGSATYRENSSVTYAIVVSNPAGPNAVNGALITDIFPPQIVLVNWTCAPAGGATCTANGSGDINDTVNLPVGSFVIYTANATIGSGVSGDLINTATVSVPAGYTDPNPGNNSATDINSYEPSADLRVTKGDGGLTVYEAGGTIVYTVIASNNGPDDVVGAIVGDNLPPQVDSWDWACTAVVNASGCNGVIGSTTNFTDVVNIQSGGRIEYTVTARISASPSGNLVNTATITGPVGVFDPVPGNNSAMDTNEFAASLPSGQIGTAPDGNPQTLPPGSSITLAFGSPIIVGSHAGYDLVYYEFPNGTGIFMDLIILEIGDGTNWYTILNWGDGIPDTNTNIDINIIGGSETDNREIASAFLWNLTGVAIDLESVVPNGTYYYIRITSPIGDSGDGAEVDAIEILP